MRAKIMRAIIVRIIVIVLRVSLIKQTLTICHNYIRINKMRRRIKTGG